nr:NAD(P)-dependent oxidoreductase [Brachybacterium muris]
MSWHGSAIRSPGAHEVRVAVTGATGYIGQQVVVELRRQGYRVAPLTRGGAPGKYRDMLLGDVGTLTEHFTSCQHVIHLAGQLVHDRDAGPLAYFAANVELTNEVMCAAVETGLASVVHASSRLVYPATLREPAIEDRDACPDTAYGISKRWSEDLVRHVSASSSISATSLRIAQVTGGDHPGLGVVNSFIRQAGSVGEITVNGRGEAIREIVHVTDVARAFVSALDRAGEWQAINIGGTRSVTIAEIAHLVADATQSDVDVRHVDVDDEDLSRYALDSTRARDELAWEPSWRPEDIIQEAIKGRECAS